jgi:hypothetical protein
MATGKTGYPPNRVVLTQEGNLQDGGGNTFAGKVTFSPAAGAANQTLVTLQVTDMGGVSLAAPFEMLVYLSDDPGGNGLSGTTASGAVAAGSAGTVLSTKVTKLALDVLTDNTGKFIIAITDTAKTGWYVVATCPGSGNVQVSAQLVAANYG